MARRDSFQRRLSWVMVGVATATAAVTCTLLVTLHVSTARRAAHASLETQVRVVAIHSEAPLSFGDDEAGTETLAAFRATPGVVWAALYDAAGHRFALYDPRGTAPPPVALPEVESALTDRGLLVLMAPVSRQRERLGSVVAAYDLSAVYRGMWREIGLSIAAGLAVVVAAALTALSLRRRLTEPMRELVATARRVSEEGDHAARAHKHGEDEFGDLTDTFNTMLDRIEAQQAELQRRNEEMQRFLYTVSHDLKSPLVTITGFAGLAREDVAHGRYDQLYESLRHLDRAAQHMGRLIENLLELSRIGRVRPRPEWIDTTLLAREVVEQLEPRIRDAGASVQLQHDLPRVYADPVRLRQVLENLLTNAIKYGVDRDRTSIEVGGAHDGNDTRLYVRDHGRGIPPEHAERVFALFQRLHKSDDGTGVGLTIVSKIVEAGGGRVWLEPTPGGGATFWISLPSPDDRPVERS